MSKKIISVGYEIPGHSEDHVAFESEQSLMEADILLISPDSLEPSGHWVEFTSSDSGCYDVDASRIYKQKIARFKKEVEDHLNVGKNVFIFLTKKEEYSLAHGVSTEKKGQRSYSTGTYHNYAFLPVDLGTLISASGNHIEFAGDPIFSDFYKAFGKNLRYQLYIENPDQCRVIFTGKDKNKVLGALFKVAKGYIVVLPYVEYDEDKFTTTKKDKKGQEKSYWTKDAITFGNTLIGKLTQIDRDLGQDSEKTPPPEWAQAKEFFTSREVELQSSIAEESEKISKIQEEIQKLHESLTEEQILKNLLYEKGKTLENAINAALKILGYKAENYNDGNLEIDHVITSSEGDRFIGEAEGKDASAINIDKFRQLATNIQEDLQREEITSPATGILFGNGYRLTDPVDRAEQFTEKCINTAKSSNCILLRTYDLFRVTKYIKESRDEEFARLCRERIKNSTGKIVDFPGIPTSK